MVNPWVIPLAAIGLAISFYIFYTQSKKKDMICIRGKDCDAVVSSKYNKTFGISNVGAGLFYYASVIVLAALILGGVAVNPLEVILLIIAIGAGLFSIYLTAIQAFVLRIWCEYCVTSAVASILILILELISFF